MKIEEIMDSNLMSYLQTKNINIIIIKLIKISVKILCVWSISRIAPHIDEDKIIIHIVLKKLKYLFLFLNNW